jgi:hypothetical protein
MSNSPDDRNPAEPGREQRTEAVEKRAVKTTIVGGQPPGNERPLPPIPVGIEEILGMAAVNDDFAKALYANRDSAVSASGVELTATERGILAAIDAASLRQMVGNVDGVFPNRERRAFLARSAAALLVLAGGGAAAAAVAACSDSKKKSGVHPTGPEPADAEAAAALPPDAGDAPADAALPDDAAPLPPDARPRPPEVPQTRGISPDRPKPAGARPDRPRPTKGIRPDRPPPIKKPTRGIRPDLPDDDEQF